MNIENKMPKEHKFPMSWEESVQTLRNNPNQQRLVRACYFDDPIEEAAMRYSTEEEWQTIKTLLPSKHGKALDVGSGRGISAYALANSGWDVTALEPDSSKIVGAGAIQELSQKTNTPIKIVSEWGESLPFKEKEFQLIHARQVLHHARDIEKFCTELFRVCDNGGTLIATREHVIDKDSDLPKFLAAHPLHHLYGGENAFTLKQYIHSLEKAGFIIQRILSPYESPINYFPATESEVNKNVLRCLIGPRLSSRINIQIPKFIIRFFSKHFMTTPGRLYTFVALKPKKHQDD